MRARASRSRTRRGCSAGARSRAAPSRCPARRGARRPTWRRRAGTASRRSWARAPRPARARGRRASGARRGASCGSSSASRRGRRARGPRASRAPRASSTRRRRTRAARPSPPGAARERRARAGYDDARRKRERAEEITSSSRCFSQGSGIAMTFLAALSMRSALAERPVVGGAGSSRSRGSIFCQRPKIRLVPLACALQVFWQFRLRSRQ